MRDSVIYYVSCAIAVVLGVSGLLMYLFFAIVYYNVV